MTAVFLSVSLNTKIEMKAISLSRSGLAVEQAKAFIAAKSVTIAAISAAVCLAAVLLGSEVVMFAAAFSAMAAVRKHAEEGGEK